MSATIIKATRAHYAALQHKPSADRVALDYEVSGHTAGTIWVKAPTNALRKANLTKLRVRLTAMFPEAHTLSVGFRDSLNGVGPPTVPLAPVVQLFRVQVQADSSGEWCGNGLKFDTYAEAEAYAKDLSSRWTAVREWRVVMP